MEEKITVTNIGAQRVTCGGKVIFPTQSRQVPASARGQALANPNLVIADVEGSLTGPTILEKEKKEKSLAEILKHKVPEAVELAEALSLEELEELKALEENSERRGVFGIGGGPRKSLLEELEAMIELRKEEAEEG